MGRVFLAIFWRSIPLCRPDLGPLLPNFAKLGNFSNFWTLNSICRARFGGPKWPKRGPKMGQKKSRTTVPRRAKRQKQVQCLWAITARDHGSKMTIFLGTSAYSRVRGARALPDVFSKNVAKLYQKNDRLLRTRASNVPSTVAIKGGLHFLCPYLGGPKKGLTTNDTSTMVTKMGYIFYALTWVASKIGLTTNAPSPVA